MSNFLDMLLLLQPTPAPEATSPGIFTLATNVSFWTVVIFVILLFILKRFAYPPILGYAAAREARIQEALDEARRQREEAERLLEEQRQELAQAKQQSQQVMAEGRQAAERIRQELIETARAEQQEIIGRARQEIERERDKAIESLRREAIDLAMAAAAKLVGDRLTADDDRRLVTEYLQRVEAGASGAGVV
jgi:F-type H+-transporting ATPase subunit b